MDSIKCDWCKEETINWIVAFDGRKICKDKDPCWSKGTKISHSVKGIR